MIGKQQSFDSQLLLQITPDATPCGTLVVGAGGVLLLVVGTMVIIVIAAPILG